MPYAERGWVLEESEALRDFKRRRRAAEVPLATFRLPDEEMKGILVRAKRAREEEEERTAGMVSTWKEAMEEGLRRGGGCAASDRGEGPSQAVELCVEEERAGTQSRKELLARLRREVSATQKRRRVDEL